MRDAKPTSPKSLHPSSGLSQFLLSRMGPGSPKTQQFAGGNASAIGDHMWGTPRASHGIHFPDSLQKPLPAHAAVHAETQQMYRDQQHLEFWAKS